MRALIAAIVALATPVFAEPVHTAINLRNGATWTITSERKRVETGDQAKSWGLTTVKGLTWRAGEGGKPAQLRITPISVIPTSDSAREVVLAHTLTISINLEVEDSLKPGTILNLDEFRASFSTEAIREMGGANPVAAGTAKSMVVGDLMLTARGQNTRLTIGYPSTINEPAPPYPTLNVYELASYDAASSRAVVNWEQSADFREQLVQQVTLATLKTRPRATREEIREITDGLSGHFRSRCRHVIDIPTGLAVKVECQGDMLMTMFGKTRGFTETWVITQTLPEPR